MFVLTLSVFTMLVVRGSSSNYFFAYYLDQQSIRALLASVGLAGLGGEATGWKAALDGLGLLVKPDNSNASAVGLSLFFVVGSLVQIAGIIASKPLADRFGKKAVFIAGVAVTTVATAGGVPRRPDVGGPAVLAGHPVGRRLGPDRAAAVGDDRRRGGLLGVEDVAPRDGIHVRGHPVRAEGGPEPGRRVERVDHRRLRLRAERRAVRARAAGHPARRQRLSRPHARHRARLPGHLPDWQGARPADPGGAHRAPQALRSQRRTRWRHTGAADAPYRDPSGAPTSGPPTCSRG